MKRAKRGPRMQRQNVYLNMIRVHPASTTYEDENNILCSHLSEDLAEITVPEGWSKIENNPDCISLVRPEKWEFNKTRAVTEVVVTKSPNSGSTFITIRAHGCEHDLSDVPSLSTSSIKNRIIVALNFVEKSTFCTGISLPQGEGMQPIPPAPHVTCSFKDLLNDGQETTKLFSSNCKIFSFHGARCTECSKLLKNYNIKKQRKEKRNDIHPFCNKRYLSKEEVNFQLQLEKRKRILAEMREKYWKEKFENESVQLEEDDHNDVAVMLKGVSKDNVPEEMTCLWEQQKKILKTNKKRGYRWHPK